MAVLMVAGFFPVIANAEETSAKGVASATVSVSTAKVGAGGNAKVTISLSEGSDVAMAQFAVKYDSSIFKFVSASSGEVMGDVTTNSYEDGTVYFGWDDPTPVTAGGTILELVFRVPDNAELGEYPVEIDTEEEFVFADADSNNLDMKIENGKIVIIDGIYGDLNGDEKINVEDAYLARLIATKLITPEETKMIFGDVDLDHKITVIDANLLRRYAVKLIEKLPYRNEEPEGNEPQKPGDGEYAVAMITDYGDITDQSFNQTTYEACKAFCDENDIPFEYYKPAADSDDDFIECIEMAIDDGYNVIVMPGFAFANAIIAVADEYPEVKFVALDISEFDLTGNGWTIPENVYSAVYQEEISGYMAGYAAVKLGYTELGFLGGMAVPAVCRYGYGFLQGADAAAVETGADVSVVWGYANQFYGDADITAVMDTWYGEGTEVVFVCGGGVYTSVAEAAAKVGGKVIGVDVDQAGIIDGAYGEGMTVTSAMKGLAPTVKTILGKIVSGEFEGGQVERLGIVSADPEKNYVQLASSTQFNDLFTYNDYSALVKEIFEGRITVNDDITGAPADYVTVISVCDIGEEPEGNEPQKPGDGEYAVAMITDYGDITDQSFNQTTYEACKAFCDENDIPFEYYKPAADSDDDFIECIEMAIDDGYNVIVMPGFAFANAIIAVADEYPEVKFVALDISEFDLTGNGWTIPENVYSAVYQEEISGYMAGYAAVKLGYTELGFLGGMAVPAVCRYGYGFLQGADAAAVETGADVSVVWGYANQFYGDADITAVMDTWYGEGTEVVFVCGGGVYTSVAEAAAKVGGKVIGVDVDQAGIIDGAYGEGMTVTSAMKGLAPTVKTILGKIVSGEFEGGQVERLGIVSADPEKNYVQLASSTQFNDLFTYNDYSALVKEIFEGRITVNDDITGAPADYVTVISVCDIGNVK